MGDKLNIGTINIPEQLKRSSVLFLYSDGSWRTGLSLDEDWIVCIDIHRRSYTSNNTKYDCDRKLYGFNWCKCIDNRDNTNEPVKYIIVSNKLETHLSDISSTNRNDIGFILLPGLVYLDKDNNLHNA